MERETLTLEKPVRFGQTSVIAVSRTRICSRSGRRWQAAFGMKEPIAVIVETSAGKAAFRISGEKIELDQLIKQSPTIKDDLKKLV